MDINKAVSEIDAWMNELPNKHEQCLETQFMQTFIGAKEKGFVASKNNVTFKCEEVCDYENDGMCRLK